MGVLFFLTTSQVLYASSKLTVDEMKKLALKKSETQKIVEEMLNHNQAGCGKELEKNEYAAKLDKIPIQDRQFQEIISTYKKGRYNLFDGRTNEFVLGITYRPDALCSTIILHGQRAKRTQKNGRIRIELD